MPDEDLSTALLEVLEAPGASIEGLTRLSGGASRETFAFDLVDGTSRRPLILQRVRGKATTATGIGIGHEAELLRAARAARVPVAEVVAADDGSVLGAAVNPYPYVAAAC